MKSESIPGGGVVLTDLLDSEDKHTDEYAHIPTIRLIMMRQCIRSEAKGLRLVRHSVWAQAKRELNIRGSREKVVHKITQALKARGWEPNREIEP